MSKKFVVPVSDAFYKHVQKLSVAERRTVTNFVRYALEQYTKYAQTVPSTKPAVQKPKESSFDVDELDFEE